MTDVAIRLHDVTRVFDGPPTVTAVSEICLNIQSGERVAVVGPSGSGKSTLLNLIGTLDRPTTGSVEINGVNTATLSDIDLARIRSQYIGFIFQQFHLIGEMTVKDNVEQGLIYQGVERKHRSTMAARAIELVGLSNKLLVKTKLLSGGQMQRAAIARAIANKPRIVLADEPTGNLDSAASQAVEEILETISADGATVVVITHDPAFAAGYPRSLAMLDGKVAQDSFDRALDITCE